MAFPVIIPYETEKTVIRYRTPMFAGGQPGCPYVREVEHCAFRASMLTAMHYGDEYVEDTAARRCDTCATRINEYREMQRLAALRKMRRFGVGALLLGGFIGYCFMKNDDDDDE